MSRIEMADVKDRIRRIAQNTDGLILRLDNLTNRIDMAKRNENSELVEYYERQFADVSLEFMEGVETMIDDWYLLKGIPRPPAEEENLSPEILDEIHGTLVDIVQERREEKSLEDNVPQAAVRTGVREVPETTETVLAGKVQRSRNRVDLTG